MTPAPPRPPAGPPGPASGPAPAARHPVAVLGTGAYLPDRRVTSEELSRDLGLDPRWIADRTAIAARHVAAPGQAASDLAAHAARRALADAGLTPADIGLIVVGTSTPDELGPATACRVQALLGARRAAAFDVAAACTGFVFGVQAAVGWLATQRGAPPRALVIGVEVYSRFLDPTDRATAALFGDGAAAAVLGPAAPPAGIVSLALGSDGTRADDVLIPAGGSRSPASPATLTARGHTIHMDGRAVRDFITGTFPRLVTAALDDAGVKPADLALVVPHQPNPRLTATLGPAAGLDPAQIAVAGHDVGNIGAASLPYALHHALRTRTPPPDALVLLAGFGAGLTWGHVLLRWPA
ncbi:Acetoacetyl CoA synthase NphT7 [Actinomadura rubteroloni]|uniref:Acetoacetyl CoA synthase NphT7 n=1 Tax=Actinomadura rubteroloni TaxID=1926885 RepID=A0A2P4UC36_9ACTN|nr:ketoacyl-ACP synthase III [Actinomadura rubteroloni]POM22611.1 Acetoacetyl CoA synthase NphT7 [Actinomadura rubteroloni]